MGEEEEEEEEEMRPRQALGVSGAQTGSPSPLLLPLLFPNFFYLFFYFFYALVQIVGNEQEVVNFGSKRWL